MIFRRVQSQIIGILVALLLFFTTVIFIFQQQEKADVIEEAKNENKTQTNTFRIVTDLSSQSLINFSKDYTNWDELIQAVGNKDRHWVELNVFTGMPTFNIQHVWIYDNNFNLVFSSGVNDTGRVWPLPVSTGELRAVFGKSSMPHFFSLEPNSGHLIEISGARIHKTDDMERKYPSHGYLVAAREWNSTHISTFSKIINGTINLQFLDKKSSSVFENDPPYHITSKIVLKDWKGEDLCYLLLTKESEDLKESIRLSNSKVVYLSFFVIITFIVIALFLIRFIFNPLRSVANALSREDPDQLSSIKHHDSEFSNLADLIRSFFRQKNELVETQTNLEQRIEERTIELAQKNRILTEEIDERKKIENALIENEEKLKLSNEQLHELAVHLQTVREEERAVIARDIHDDMGQVLTALNYELSMLEKEIRSDGTAIDESFLLAEIGEMQRMITLAIERVRKMISQLRPDILDNLGILNAIIWQIRGFEKRTQIKCSFDCGLDRLDLDKNRSIAVYRVLQEALTNIARHSGATEAGISLNSQNGSLVLIISDNGKGFDCEKVNAIHSIGLTGMKERASICGGTLEIISSPGRGARIILTAPLIL